jgi:predicted nucleic acid-binding protein
MKLLDTSVLVRLGNPEREATVRPYLQQHATESFITSSLVLFEFFRPPKRRQNLEDVRRWVEGVLDSVEPFTQSTALRAARINESLRSQGRELEMRDLLIAAHARELGGQFVTCDSGDFENEAVQQLLDVDVIG